jgi:hypothetical protein
VIFVVLYFLSEGHSDPNDEPSDPFEQDHDDRHLGKDTGPSQASNLGLRKDTEIILGSGVSSLRGRPEGLEFPIPVGTPDDLGNEPRKLPNRKMLGLAC